MLTAEYCRMTKNSLKIFIRLTQQEGGTQSFGSASLQFLGFLLMVTKWLLQYHASHPHIPSKTESEKLAFPLKFSLSFYQDGSLHTHSSMLLLKTNYLFLDQSLHYGNGISTIGFELEWFMLWGWIYCPKLCLLPEQNLDSSRSRSRDH